MSWTLIEKKTVTTVYGFIGIEAVVFHQKHGRILLIEDYGGVDTLDGGAVRWVHGAAYKLKKDDTFAVLDKKVNEHYNLMTAVIAHEDDERVYLPWSGEEIAKIAKSIGLN